MTDLGFGGFAPVESVEVEIYTSACRISGAIHTRFRRVAEILNQLPSGHVAIGDATVAEYAAFANAVRTGETMVAVDEILAMMAPGLGGQPRAEMRIPKERAAATILVPPLRLAGTVHVPIGSRALDGLINVADRFVPMTDVTITSAAYPALDRQVPILAVRRDRAQVIVAESPDGPAVDAEPPPPA